MKTEFFFGIKKEWFLAFIFILAPVIYMIWLDLGPKPKVKFGYVKSTNSLINQFYEKTIESGLGNEDIINNLCQLQGGRVEDYAAYNKRIKGIRDKRIMEVIEPHQGFMEGWLKWEQRLYKKAPMYFSTVGDECVLYKAKGVRRQHRQVGSRIGDVALSCCWKY